MVIRHHGFKYTSSGRERQGFWDEFCCLYTFASREIIVETVVAREDAA